MVPEVAVTCMVAGWFAIFVMVHIAALTVFVVWFVVRMMAVFCSGL